MKKITTGKQLFTTVKKMEKEHIKQQTKSNKELLKERKEIEKAKESFKNHTQVAEERNKKSYEEIMTFIQDTSANLTEKELYNYRVLMLESAQKEQLDNLPYELKDMQAKIKELETQATQLDANIIELKKEEKVIVEKKAKQIKEHYAKQISSIK